MRVSAASLALLLVVTPACAGAQDIRAHFDSLAAKCAPSIHPQTLAAVVKQESAFNPLAIGVNGPKARPVKARNQAHAIALASELIAAGASVDLGLGQINSANLRWLGLTVSTVFDPCKNLAAAARVLKDGYKREVATAPNTQVALDRALSRYNTGNSSGGLRNGYVAAVRRQVKPAARALAAASPVEVISITQEPTRPAPSWDAFAQAEVQREQWDVFANQSRRGGNEGNRSAE